MSEDEDQEEGEGEQEHVQILKGPPSGRGLIVCLYVYRLVRKDEENNT